MVHAWRGLAVVDHGATCTRGWRRSVAIAPRTSILEYIVVSTLERPLDADRLGGVIGRLHHVILDCPEPEELAEFYAELLGLPVTYRSDDFVVVSADTTTSGLAFQRAPDHRPPHGRTRGTPSRCTSTSWSTTWASRRRGAGPRRAARSPATHVYADPAGHPFCLIPRPSWAPPVQA